MLQTTRLSLRTLTTDDAGFVMELVNDPDFIRYIGDREVHSIEAAAKYIIEGPWSHYTEPGFGQLLVCDRDSGQPMGLCGLLRRDYLQHPDIGFAFLAPFRKNGYAQEAAMAVIDVARSHNLATVVGGIVSPDNEKSIKLLEKLGMRYVRELEPDEVASPAHLYAGDFSKLL